MKLKTSCDMGNIKIFTEDMSCFFENGIGDVMNTVEIFNNTSDESKWLNAEFLGHFTVKTKAWLSGYDCADDDIYTFTKGRYFVYLKEPAHFMIVKEDEDVHA